MRFEKAFQIVIGAEGGYVNDPNDPGGETKYGISKAAYPSLNIAALTLEEAKGIYRRDYWQACRCDDFPAMLRLPLFDSAVNQGVSAAIKLLQQILRVDVDGIIGPKTIGAANSSDTKELVLDFLSYRALRYVETRNFDRYGRGWLRRMFSITMELNSEDQPAIQQPAIVKPSPAQPKGKAKIVNADYLAFRSTPAGQTQPLILQKGQVLQTLESIGDWERVSFLAEGWVSKKYLI